MGWREALRRIGVGGLAVVLVLVARERAARARERIVVEITDGPMTAERRAWFDALYAALAARRVDHGPALAAEIDAAVSREGGALSASAVLAAKQGVDQAYQDFVNGDYPTALAAVRQARAIYDSAPGHLAREPALRDLRYRGLLIEARSAEVVGDGEAAFAAMAEAIRTFPDRPVDATEFDPKVVALYRRVKQELTRQGSGALEIRVDEPAAVIFVNERFVGTGTAKVEHLLPGRYRVYAATASAPGRVRSIEVAPGASATVTVPWQVDGHVRTSDGIVALAEPRDAGLDVELGAAVALARALGKREVIVLAVRTVEQRVLLAGYSVNVASQSRVYAAVQLEPVAPTAEVLRNLAALLAGDRSASGEGLIRTEPGTAVVAARPVAPVRHRSRIAPIVLGGLGLVGLVGAVGLELSARASYDASTIEPDDRRQGELYDAANRKRYLAEGAAALGLGCAATAAYLWLRGGASPIEHGPAVQATIGADRVGIMVMGAF